MNAHEYQSRHFEMMRRIVEQLPEIPVQFLAHEYSYSTMGSWWFTYMRRGERFSVVLDGREDYIRLDQKKYVGLRGKWEEIDQVSILGADSEGVVEAVLKLIRRN